LFSFRAYIIYIYYLYFVRRVFFLPTVDYRRRRYYYYTTRRRRRLLFFFYTYVFFPTTDNVRGRGGPVPPSVRPIPFPFCTDDHRPSVALPYHHHHGAAVVCPPPPHIPKTRPAVFVPRAISPGKTLLATVGDYVNSISSGRASRFVFFNYNILERVPSGQTGYIRFPGLGVYRASLFARPRRIPFWRRRCALRVPANPTPPSPNRFAAAPPGTFAGFIRSLALADVVAPANSTGITPSTNRPATGLSRRP